MKSVVLVPYCPLPADTGGKREMWRHLELLKELGDCCIVSASCRPVGAGWTPEIRRDIETRGFRVVLREDSCRRSAAQLLGLAYGAVCKAAGLEKAFGHANPYHRYAFPADWWRRLTEGADVAVINYSYWARLPCECPKAVLMYDLWSDFMWGGARTETADLMTADLLVMISKEEERTLNGRGLGKTLWVPPTIPSTGFPVSSSVGCLGSENEFNREGLRWLESGWDSACGRVRVYGALSKHVTSPCFDRIGEYRENTQPCSECGIILIPTSGGMGVQIKTIEALAAGRAIVARKGGIRGLPPGEGAWLEVDTPEEMCEAASTLMRYETPRMLLAEKARAYYKRHLDHEKIRSALKEAYAGLAGRSGL